MPVLNFFPCGLKEELVVWQNISISSVEYQKLAEKHQFIRFPDNKRKIAYPMRPGCEGILNSLGFKSVTVRTSDYLNAFSDLCKYGFVSLLMDEGFQAFHESPAEVERNSVSKLYGSSIYQFPPSNPALKIYEGIEVRKQYWNFPTAGPIGGISISYITTPYFIKPMDEILEGTDLTPYVRMECPMSCREKNCLFYSEGGLIGKFAKFTDNGFRCKFEGGYEKFVLLLDKRPEVKENPPANRVNIEPSYATVCQWAEKKYGEEEIRTKIREARGELVSGKRNVNKARHEYNSILKLIDRLPTEFQLPNGQTATWDKNMLKIEV